VSDAFACHASTIFFAKKRNPFIFRSFFLCYHEDIKKEIAQPGAQNKEAAAGRREN